MRKKTIQEELEELEREKEEHIKKVSKKTGHNDDHVYDFDAKYETHDFEEAAKNDYGDNDEDIEDIDDIDDVPETDIEKMQENIRKKLEAASSNKSSSVLGNGLFYFILIIPLLFLIGILIGGSLMIANLGVKPIIQNNTFVEVTSTVQEIELNHDSDGDIYAKISVVYVYDNQEYKYDIRDYTVNKLSDLPEIGKEIKIKVNPNDPDEVILPVSGNNNVGSVMCIIFGGVLVLVGLAGSISITKMLLGKKQI